MWETKTWPRTTKGKAAYEAWIAKHEATHQIDIIFVNNGYGVSYKKLRWAY